MKTATTQTAAEPVMKMLIGGEWIEAEQTRPLVNPSTGEVVALAPLGTEADMERAIAAAVQGFEILRKLSNGRRAEILADAATLIEERAEAFAQSMTRETGKPIRFARAEVQRALMTLTLSAEEAKRLGGEYLPLDLAEGSEGRWGVVRRFPLGPVGAITPFNFPLNLVAHKVGPALAAGCSVVLKPASVCPGAALLMGEAFMEAGLPPGALNILPCPGPVAEKLASDERIKKITFTGSSAVGWQLKQKAYRKQVTLELGGNAGVIIEPDADLAFAVPRLAVGAFAHAGQVCIAVQRIYVHQSLYERFKTQFVDYTQNQVKMGDPLDPEVMVGPMIELAEAQRVEAWVDEAVAEGARLLTGGRRQGAFYTPTILERPRPTSKVSCREVFGPVVTLEPYADFHEALAQVNDSEYGLQAALFSNDLRKINTAFQELEVGGLIVNDYPTYRIDHMPYGGMKNSGFGREGVRYAVESMTAPRLLALNPGRPS